MFGAVLMFFVQPLLFSGEFISVDISDIETWIITEYTSSTYWVIGSAVVATIFWYISASGAKPLKAKDTSSWRLLWWGFLLIPVVSVGIALSLQSEASVRLWLTAMYIVDIAVLYWFATAGSSPGHTKYLPPGSRIIRNMNRV
jgi:hypothetical protein